MVRGSLILIVDLVTRVVCSQIGGVSSCIVPGVVLGRLSYIFQFLHSPVCLLLYYLVETMTKLLCHPGK